MAEYKGYLILGKALKVYPDSAHWFSQGDVFTNEPAGSTLVARVGGAIFDSKQVAKAQGLELCREWINQKRAIGENRRRRVSR